MGACLAHKERLHFSHRADSYRLLHSHHDSPDALSACLPGHMGLYLSEPVREVHHTSLGGGEVEVGGAHVQGWRLDQEDSVALCHLDTKHTMAAVFDGHGGREVRASGCAPVALTRHALWDIPCIIAALTPPHAVCTTSTLARHRLLSTALVTWRRRCAVRQATRAEISGWR